MWLYIAAVWQHSPFTLLLWLQKQEEEEVGGGRREEKRRRGREEAKNNHCLWPCQTASWKDAHCLCGQALAWEERKEADGCKTC